MVIFRKEATVAELILSHFRVISLLFKELRLFNKGELKCLKWTDSPIFFKNLRRKNCIVDNLLITQKSFQQAKNRQNFPKSELFAHEFFKE